MAGSVKMTILIGSLGKNPESRYTKEGKKLPPFFGNIRILVWQDTSERGEFLNSSVPLITKINDGGTFFNDVKNSF